MQALLSEENAYVSVYVCRTQGPGENSEPSTEETKRDNGHRDHLIEGDADYKEGGRLQS